MSDSSDDMEFYSQEFELSLERKRRKMSNSNKKKFNLTITPMWETKSQNLMSIEVTEDILKALDQVELGGKLMIKRLDEDRRKNDKSPHAYLEYLDKAEVDAYKAKQGSRSNDSL